MKKLVKIALIFCVTCGTLFPQGSYDDSALYSELDNSLYSKLDNGNIRAPDGTEYVYFAHEGAIETFEAHSFLGGIRGEPISVHPNGLLKNPGMYSCENDPDLKILYRVVPNSEWASYYRKASLPQLDLSVENCVRLEFIRNKENIRYDNNRSPDIKHLFCDENITGLTEIQNFLLEVKKQQSAQDAGLYDIVRKPNGFLENCYELGHIYGYFKNETNLAIPLKVMSFNDKAYSITIGKEYVFPESYLEIFNIGK